MPEYINRPERRVAGNPKAVINYLARLNKQGLSQREISARADIPRRTLRDYLKGNYAPREERAKLLAAMINQRIEDPDYLAKLPNARGKMIMIDPISKKDRAMVRAYREEILKMAVGDGYDLTPFKDISIRVRGKNKMEKYKLVTNEETLNRMIEQGQMEDIQFVRNQSS
jgi:transcriptional regulator with XRE-family HTH domain